MIPEREPDLLTGPEKFQEALPSDVRLRQELAELLSRLEPLLILNPKLANTGIVRKANQ